MADLIERQAQLFRSLERSLENFKKIGKHNLTPAKIRNQVSALNVLWTAIQDGHHAIRSQIPSESQLSTKYFTENWFDKYEEIYLSTSDYMADCLEELQPNVSPNQSLEQGRLSFGLPSALSLAHLPPIQLPPFDGRYEDWESFRDRFTSLIINNHELSDFVRMHFLTMCLTGRALDCIKSYPVTADNFHVAWDVLKSRFESKRRLINVQINNLLNLPAVQKESALELQSLRDRINSSVAALTNLNRSPEDLWNDMLVCLASQKLDAVTRKAWNIKYSDERSPPSYDMLSQFLNSRIRALEDSKLPQLTTEKTIRSNNTPRINSATASAHVQGKCSFCKSNHFVQNCSQLLSKSPNQRRELIKRENLCFNCLSKDHAVNTCQSKHRCKRCQKKHHTMLHVDSDSYSKVVFDATTTSPSTTVAANSNEINSLLASTVSPQRSHVLLATARVMITSSSGRSICARALLDQGSEMTFITERLAQGLRVNRVAMPISVSAVGGVNAGTYRSAAQIQISPRNGSTPVFTALALILKTLTAYSPERVPRDPALDHLADIPWADDDPMSSEPIDVLIGADLYGELLLEGVRKSTSGRPVAQQTFLGWVISGPIATSRVSVNNTSMSIRNDPSIHRVNSLHCCNSLSLDQELRRFWEVEEIPKRIMLSPDDEKCEEHFRATHSRGADGRYTVRIPFKEGPPIDIGESRHIAEKCLNGLTRRFHAHPAQEQEYIAFLQEYENLGHMKEIPASQSDGSQRVFIPHHPVIRESSATTHLRVVFNASSITTNGSSLNDHQLAGPKLQTELPAVILKWRKSKFVYMADITKMYRQIFVDQRDASYQNILWKSPSSETASEFQLLTVTYGTASAPFLALRVLKQLVIDEGQEFPLAVPILREQIYVDDVLFGADDIDLLRETRGQVRELLSRGGFELRKWASNRSELLSDIASENHGLACNKVLQIDDGLKVLGISWNPFNDHFKFSVELVAETPRSKRTILSMIAKLFDPLGWVTPATITTKVFMQSLWRLRVGWDDEIPPKYLTRWQTIYSQLIEINRIKLPRWTGQEAAIGQVELHGFADASSVAYAAAVYLKVVSPSGRVTVSLITGKSKVAPVKPMSIPRLELSAAVLLSRLVGFIRESLVVRTEDCHCWTDSTIVLAWLEQDPSRWKTFVANRVTEIHSLLPNISWHHVPTLENPADCASRGLLGKELIQHNLWWKGPKWLPLPRARWPEGPTSKPAASLLEIKTLTVHSATPRIQWDLANKFSSWPRLIRVTAYALKFVNRCRGRRRGVEPCLARTVILSASDCRLARSFWIKTVQMELFPGEVGALSTSKPISRKSSIVSLNPFLDEEGILRVGGRLTNAPIPFESKHPIILASHPIVILIIRQAHLRSLHAGLQLTLNSLRQEFWILKSRSVVRTVIHNCVICVRERASVPEQLMGNLPAFRISPPSRSFQHSGVDYAGPVLVRASSGRGIKSGKAYIALFVCLATRAIHLELVGDYSASAFLDAFSRFCARRGLPESIYSDNGTTFVSADRELTLAYRAAVRDKNFLNSTASDNIKWHFIPPSAPHFGGIWEAGVRSVKHHLRRVLRNQTLTFKEFTTLLCRVEACLNSRPIAPLNDTPDDLEILTPGHFLIGSALTVNPEPSVLNLAENRLSRWQRVRQLTERFWKIWQTDYVNTLQQRGKWQRIQSSVKVGQLVLLRNATLPPCKWELGRITHCHVGSDGLIRVVTVKTATSSFKRPIVKICLLPIDCKDTGSDSAIMHKDD